MKLIQSKGLVYEELWLLLSKKFSAFDLDAWVFVLRSWVKDGCCCHDDWYLDFWSVSGNCSSLEWLTLRIFFLAKTRTSLMMLLAKMTRCTAGHVIARIPQLMCLGIVGQ